MNVSQAHFENLESRIESRLKVLEISTAHLQTQVSKHAAKLLDLHTKLVDIDERTKLIPVLYDNVDKMLKEVIQTRQELVFMNSRISRLEDKVFS